MFFFFLLLFLNSWNAAVTFKNSGSLSTHGTLYYVYRAGVVRFVLLSERCLTSVSVLASKHILNILYCSLFSRVIYRCAPTGEGEVQSPQFPTSSLNVWLPITIKPHMLTLKKIKPPEHICHFGQKQTSFRKSLETTPGNIVQCKVAIFKLWLFLYGCFLTWGN